MPRPSTLYYAVTPVQVVCKQPTVICVTAGDQKQLAMRLFNSVERWDDDTCERVDDLVLIFSNVYCILTANES